MSRKVEKKATGIFVNFYSDNVTNDPNKSWKTDSYQYEQDWGGKEDGQQ